MVTYEIFVHLLNGPFCLKLLLIAMQKANSKRRNVHLWTKLLSAWVDLNFIILFLLSKYNLKTNEVQGQEI